ncbi:MAG: hypothetical protein JWQ13_444, partial [Ramlibacter sp.]|nr:hypothetical protein [Ramlibacter sp.]
ATPLASAAAAPTVPAVAAASSLQRD